MSEPLPADHGMNKMIDAFGRWICCLGSDYQSIDTAQTKCGCTDGTQRVHRPRPCTTNCKADGFDRRSGKSFNFIGFCTRFVVYVVAQQTSE
jgi:hypothetical protein